MNDWGASVYGDPCRECGFRWTMPPTDAVALVSGLPSDLAGTLAGRSGHERHPELAWSVAEYVVHVADNLRIWAERLMGVVGGASPSVGGYDERDLARARNYRAIPLAAAMWSLTRSVDDWRSAVERAPVTGTVLVHPERGDLTRTDVVLATAHDALHHRADIGRILRSPEPCPGPFRPTGVRAGRRPGPAADPP